MADDFRPTRLKVAFDSSDLIGLFLAQSSFSLFSFFLLFQSHSYQTITNEPSQIQEQPIDRLT